MTKATETRFRKVLQARRAELLREIQQKRERLGVIAAADPMDATRMAAEREVLVQEVERMAGALRLAGGALREIADGTFGVCARCGGEIPIKRLQAVPWSPYCVACQQHAEALGGDGTGTHLRTLGISLRADFA